MNTLLISLRLLLVMTLLTGGIYPLLVTGAARAFPSQSEGSLIRRNGRVIGSRLIGQPFDSPEYLWGRPSATSPAYNASASGGSNLGPTNPDLFEAIAARVKRLREAGAIGPIPTDLVTSSASGLDPDISPEAAALQVSRIARARGVSEPDVRRAISSATKGRQFGFLGQPTVNVLEANLALDAARSPR